MASTWLWSFGKWSCYIFDFDYKHVYLNLSVLTIFCLQLQFDQTTEQHWGKAQDTNSYGHLPIHMANIDLHLQMLAL